MKYRLTRFAISMTLFIPTIFVSTANAHLLTINVNDASMRIDDYGRIDSLIIQGQEQLNESFWYTSVRKTGSPNPYSAPLKVDANNYNVVNHVTAVGPDGWSLKVERNVAPSDIQLEYSGKLLNDIVGDGKATFSSDAFWRNTNFLATGNTDCNCYLFIDPDLSGTPNNDIATMSQNPDGTMKATFIDQIDGEIFNVSVNNAVEWEIDNDLLLRAKLDNAITNIALNNMTTPSGPDNLSMAFKAVTNPQGLDADGCGCNITVNKTANVPTPSPVWLMSLGVIGLMIKKHKKEIIKK